MNMKNGSLTIEVRAKQTSTGTTTLCLLHPWNYEHSYICPKTNRIPNDTILRVGNIGYSQSAQEIIVFFEDENNRLVRAVEFKTGRPYADLAQLLHLFTLSVTIRYSATGGSFGGSSSSCTYLAETINFYNHEANTRHAIESESHKLIGFNNGCVLSESANRWKTDEIEKTIPFLINKLFPEQEEEFIVSETVKNQATNFYFVHSLRGNLGVVQDNSHSNLTFSQVKKNNLKQLNRSLTYAIQDGNVKRVATLLQNPNIDLDSTCSFRGNTALLLAQRECDDEKRPEKKEQYKQIIEMIKQTERERNLNRLGGGLALLNSTTVNKTIQEETDLGSLKPSAESTTSSTVNLNTIPSTTVVSNQSIFSSTQSSSAPEVVDVTDVNIENNEITNNNNSSSSCNI